MPSSQFSNATNSTNAVQPRFVPEEGDYDLSAPAPLASPHGQIQSPMYTEPIAHQTAVEHTYEDSHNLANLLEAASSVATAQATQADMMADHGVVNIATHGGGKRKRGSSSPACDTAMTEDNPHSKRRRVHVPTDPELQAVDYNEHVNVDNIGTPRTNETLLNDTCAAGVHSAAALFRRSSERTSRKYTRPPMSKLFMSLQLNPEDFLQLQAQAKAYMLDTTHPERQNCVGNRGKGDTDMVKLRLFNCVRDFLNDKAGEQFFGENVAKPGEREAIEAARALGEEKVINPEGRLIWPRDGNKIISLVTPLMRRMVTNERQRQYAIETRKGGAKKSKEGSVEATAPRTVAEHGCEQAQLPCDPKLAQYRQDSQPTSPSLGMVGAHSPARGREVLQLDGEVVGQRTTSPWLTNVKLPTACSVEPHLSFLNIFLVLASHEGKPAIKLDERRISAEHPAHLTFYDWNDFLKEVDGLLSQAKSRFPELRRPPAPLGNEIGSHSLRGLAAAANALQSDVSPTEPPKLSDPVLQEDSQRPMNEMSGTQNIAESIPSALTSDTQGLAACPGPTPDMGTNTSSPNITATSSTNDDTADDECPPRHTIKTIGPNGWTTITTEQDWYHVLREKAFAVWADGVCNVLVELPNLSAG